MALQHDGEAPYDPAKAHEYYLRTRELKGRDSASNLQTKGQKEKFAEAKFTNAQKRKAATAQSGKQRQAELAQLRANGQARREQIRQKLKATLEQITANTKAEQEKIGKAADQQIAALPGMPDGLSESQQARWKEKRAKEIQQIRGEAEVGRQKASKFAQGARKGETDAASAQREELAAGMKKILEASRQKYKKASADLKSKSGDELHKEFETIRSGR